MYPSPVSPASLLPHRHLAPTDGAARRGATFSLLFLLPRSQRHPPSFCASVSLPPPVRSYSSPRLCIYTQQRVTYVHPRTCTQLPPNSLSLPSLIRINSRFTSFFVLLFSRRLFPLLTLGAFSSLSRSPPLPTSSVHHAYQRDAAYPNPVEPSPLDGSSRALSFSLSHRLLH